MSEAEQAKMLVIKSISVPTHLVAPVSVEAKVSHANLVAKRRSRESEKSMNDVGSPEESDVSLDSVDSDEVGSNKVNAQEKNSAKKRMLKLQKQMLEDKKTHEKNRKKRND